MRFSIILFGGRRIDDRIKNELRELHERIDQCRQCESFVKPLQKPLGLTRGAVGGIVVLGQGPGNSELGSGRAFSGQAGKRLDEWLIGSGLPESNPRAGVYLTSLIKCTTADPRQFHLMQKRCRPFLLEQLSILTPNVVITLGMEAYEEIGFTGLSYDDALCQIFSSRDYLLFSLYGFDFFHLPWPHPSGRNRWHNSTGNTERLKNSFGVLAELIEGFK